MGELRRLGIVACAGLGCAAAAAPPAQKVTGPVATYWMSAQTQTGFGMPAIGGGRPSAAAMMEMMRGGAGPQHSLMLQLGSQQKPDGAPQAEHLPPPALGAGPALPLVTPEPEPTQAAAPEHRDMPQSFQQPHGRMLIFWGCGEHAPAGQPLVIDFSKIAPGQMPPGFAALSRGLAVTPMQPPSPGRSATYGEWPNARSEVRVPPTGSLVGEHVVRGDYTPEIRFALRPDQDFLSPLQLTSNTRTAAGAVQLAWGAVPGARAYLAIAMGGGQDTAVLWTSSEVQSAGFAMPDYLSPADLTRLVASRALMGPQTTACQVPKEVADAAPHALVQLAAYGGEADFVYPPRPADPKIAWNRQWQVKVRYRSSTGGLLGQPMPSMASEDGAAQPPDAPAQPETAGQRARRAMRGFGGLIPVPLPH